MGIKDSTENWVRGKPAQAMILIAALGLVIGGVIGLVGGYKIEQSRTKSDVKRLQEQIKAGVASGAIPATGPLGQRVGKVTAVKDTTITMSTNELGTQTVNTSASTVVREHREGHHERHHGRQPPARRAERRQHHRAAEGQPPRAPGHQRRQRDVRDRATEGRQAPHDQAREGQGRLDHDTRRRSATSRSTPRSWRAAGPRARTCSVPSKSSCSRRTTRSSAEPPIDILNAETAVDL